MAEYTMLINFVASLILTISFTAFIIFIFGRPNSKLNTMPWYKTFLVKFGLCFCTAGALMNALTFSNPPWTETILNVGLAMVFSWAAYFHYVEFVCLPKPELKQLKTKKKTKTKK